MAVSYEELMEKKLDRIDDRRDKRQGSLIYDALAPNAAETAQFYADLDLLADRTFADTAVGEDLTRRAAERGMLRKGAGKATFYGRFLDADGAVYPVENGTRFALEEYKYIVLGREADGRYILECETEGACGNVYLGELLPLETMPDLAKATLEELEYADLLLHVIDVSNPEWQHQAEVVENLIVELGASDLPRIDVFNKCDCVEAGDLRPHGTDICAISARTGEGVDRLLEMIDQQLDKGTRRVRIHLPYDKGGLLDMLYRDAKVENVEYGETIDVTAVCPPRVLGQIADYTPDWEPPKEDWE